MPYADCKELTLSAHLQTVEQISFQEWRVEGDPIRTFSLMPRSRAKPQPEYIPKEIRENYREACLVLADSPKASAAMARRCLQGIVRDFWGIPTNKRGNLGAEMSFIKDRLTEDTWEAIHAVRSVGDIGAHMEKDVNSIVDIEPSEADLLVQLIETLFEDWYVERHKRQKRNQQLKDLAEKKVREKKEAKKATSTKEGG